MRKLGVAAVAACGIVSVAGCQLRISEYGDDGYYDDGYYADSPSADYSRWIAPTEYFTDYRFDVSNPHLSGQLGRVRVHDDIVLATGDASPGYTTIGIYSGYVDWGFMNQVTIAGGLAHPDLVPGSVLRFDESIYSPDPSALHVSVLGCSGVEPNSWDVDQHAASVEVRVTESPVAGIRVFQWFATFETSYGSQVVSGSFEYSPEEVIAVESTPPSYQDPYTDPATVTIDHGTLSGDMGDVTGFSGEAWLQQGYGYSSYSTVELQTRGAGWATMMMVNIEGGLAHPALQPGASFSVDLTDPYAYQQSPDGLFITVVGCSGPESGTWEFDQSATHVAVDVSAGATEGSVHVSVTATFDVEGTLQTVHGAFDWSVSGSVVVPD